MTEQICSNQLWKELKMILTNNIFDTLVILIILDIILGTIKGYKTKTLDSGISKNGITRHLVVLLVTVTLTYVFDLLGLRGYSEILTGFYCFSYFLSVVENLSAIGVPFPEGIKQYFNKMKGAYNDNTRNDERK